MEIPVNVSSIFISEKGTRFYNISLSFDLCLTPISLFAAYFIAKMSYKTFRKQAQIKGLLSAHYNETFNMLKIVKSYNYEDTAFKKEEEINKELYNNISLIKRIFWIYKTIHFKNTMSVLQS